MFGFKSDLRVKEREWFYNKGKQRGWLNVVCIEKKYGGKNHKGFCISFVWIRVEREGRDKIYMQIDIFTLNEITRIFGLYGKELGFIGIT